jgi:aminoglycoside/choline kinase family phosphotransferase
MQHLSPQDCQHWMLVHQWLAKENIPTPEVISQLDARTLKLEDLGDDHLNHIWEQNPKQAEKLNQEALEQLHHLQTLRPPWKPLVWTWNHADQELKRTGRALAKRLNLSQEEVSLFQTECNQLQAVWDQHLAVPCHRDFHGENLLIFKNVLYWIDSQDLFYGPRSYDEASLIFDPYRSGSLPGHQIDFFPDIALQRLIKCCGNYLENFSNFKFKEAFFKSRKHIEKLSCLSSHSFRMTKNLLNRIEI